MKWKLFVVAILLLQQAAAQKVVSTSAQTWLGYIQNVRWSNRWGATADVHYRTANHIVHGNNLSLARVGLVYYLKDAVQLTAGYAHFHYYPAEAHKLAARPEQRGWQQLQVTTSFPRLRVMHRLRLEERWRRRIAQSGALAEGYNFNYRARYAAQLLFPLGKGVGTNKPWSLMLMDEVMLNLGKEIIYNTFDQNRIIAGVHWAPGKSAFLQAGYMYIFQQQAAAAQYHQNHVLRIFYTHNLDLRHSKKQAVSKRLHV